MHDAKIREAFSAEYQVLPFARVDRDASTDCDVLPEER